MSTTQLLAAVITPTVGAAVQAAADRDLLIKADQTYQATVAGSGVVAATVLIEFSNDQVAWLTGATMTLSGTTTASEGFTAKSSWKYKRANLTAISGTNAAVTVTMGV